MGIGTLLLHVGEILEIIKLLKEIFKELDIDQKDARNAMHSLKEFCEGPLVDSVETVVNKLTEACEELIKDALDLLEIVSRGTKDTEIADKEGADLLRSALHM